ncbi:polysaccharide deacetylase family protein [Alkalihalobacillus sp. MEB130]|uniref:polysaccharide deacetylase family protein n=1 Tax=Alkalihalobacillus sp. MEB130 TaxID=2976704 RepID=UPI0028DFA100|nr:polysaccharide deacetylase family protein [Alkalihalobacillus sp. MEB130]MDT8859185.1 polysaccharide deacetylase family protein [Alkalihalobacillus sp. MEB130]
MKRLLLLLVWILVAVGCHGEDVPTNVSHEAKETELEEKQKDEETGEEMEPIIETEEEIEETEVNGVQQRYTINKTNWLVEPIGDANEKIVLLTIDDAPEHYSVAMAETLSTLNAGAIFFVNGHFITTEEGQQKLKKIHDLGFEIGNHTMTHPNMSQLTESEQKKEIIQLNNLIEEIIGERPRFYRAPFGVNTETSNQVVKEEGMQAMNWTYGYDWEAEYQEAEALADIMVHSPFLTDGANLLMHDREWTKDALERIIIGLREKQYEIVNPKEIRIE